MLDLLFNFIKCFAFSILLNDYLRREYPEKYNEFIILSSYELIRFYSKGQILFNKIKQKTKSIIDKNQSFQKFVNEVYKKDIQRNEICQIKNDNIHIKEYVTNFEYYFEPDENSIYLFCDNEAAIESKCVNQVILHSQPFSGKYEVSNIQFILVEVKINDAAHKINLKTDKFNYYIVDNILDLKFFKYYLYVHQIDKLTSEERNKIDKLTVQIIDQNVNRREFEITNDKFIIIKKDDYIY